MSNLLSGIHFVYDVEAIGLHGEAFAVAYVVFQGPGLDILETSCYACKPTVARGIYEDHLWVMDNVPPDLPINAADPLGVRNLFWAKIQKWRDAGATFWADHAWPVDTGILHAMAAVDDPHRRRWQGPCPVHDVNTLVRFVLGRSGPGEKIPGRLDPDELPRHDPRKDALYSSRLLSLCLTQLQGGYYPPRG